MREAEYAATMASILDAEYEYPKAVRFASRNTHSCTADDELAV